MNMEFAVLSDLNIDEALNAFNVDAPSYPSDSPGELSHSGYATMPQMLF